MSDLQTKLTRFRDLVSSRQEGYVLEGDALLAEISETLDRDALHGLLRSFDDGASHDLMFSIIHAVEAWPDPDYCQALVGAVRELWDRSPYWAEVLHIRVLNSPSTLSTYLSLLESSDTSAKTAARRAFESISLNYPALSERATAFVEQFG